MKIMKIIEFNVRIMKNIENHEISCDNHNKYENHTISRENHENHENMKITFEKNVNY